MKNLALVVVASALASAQTAVAVPVVPNFTQGSMTSNTTTTSTVTETIIVWIIILAGSTR